MKILQRAVNAYTTTTRGVGDLFIGSNVKLRNELQNQQLQGVKVAVLHSESNALLVSKILHDHGATVTHFAFKGDKQPAQLEARELDLTCKEGKKYLENVLRKTDVFLDGVGCSRLEKVGLIKADVVKTNGQLIVATVDNKDAFAAMNTVKSIAIGLYLREKQTSGQVVEMADSKKYLEDLQTFMKKYGK